MPEAVKCPLAGYPSNRIIFHTRIPTSSATKLPKSFTNEPEINDYVARTKGELSASKRVNELLKRAMLDEQRERLAAEAAAFFADANQDRIGTKAFRKAALRTFDRD